MLVLKNKVTSSLLKSEKKSLFRFLVLYMAMVILMITLLSVFYYQSQEKLMLAQERAILSKYAYIQTKRLKVLHHFFDERTTYPRDPRFRSAIYDNEFVKIFSLIEEKNINFDREIYIAGNMIHFIETLDNYYLGARYLVIEIDDDTGWRTEIWKRIFGYGSAIFIFFMLFGFYLAKLFLKPMRDSIVLLDRFIKDTTHELNAPLSAILANIEMMDMDVMAEKNKKRLARINIAAKTVSTLYQDLTYLTLEHERRNEDELVEIKPLLEDRVEYFNVWIQSKKLECLMDMEDVAIVIDKRKLTRVIDNLISNAIKYNQRGGTIGFELREGMLMVWDTGIGIEKEKIPFMFDRYMRFNESEGGFGIGLSIVKKILDEYHISIEVESEIKKGTRIIIKW